MKTGSSFVWEDFKIDIESVGDIKTSVLVRWGNGPNEGALFDLGSVLEGGQLVSNVYMTQFRPETTQAITQWMFSKEQKQLIKDGTEVSIYIPSSSSWSNADVEKVNNFMNSSYELNGLYKGVIGNKHPYNVLKTMPSNMESGLEIIDTTEEKIRVVSFNTYGGEGITTCGYLIQQKEKVIIEEHINKSVKEKTELEQNGSLYCYQWVNKIALTGRTTFSTFMDRNNAFLQDVPVLLTDISYLDKGTSEYEAEIRGHIHINMLSKLSLKNELIVGLNYSEKYTKEHIMNLVGSWLEQMEFDIQRFQLACDHHIGEYQEKTERLEVDIGEIFLENDSSNLIEPTMISV